MPKSPPKGYYLGDLSERTRRVQALKDLAATLGFDGPSEFIQALADGELEVTRKPRTIETIAAEVGAENEADLLNQIRSGKIKVSKS